MNGEVGKCESDYHCFYNKWDCIWTWNEVARERYVGKNREIVLWNIAKCDEWMEILLFRWIVDKFL